MNTQASNDRRMYSGTACDECGGPTLQLHGGSIWCPSEDAHPGGHFVTRIAFERSPIKGEAKVRGTKVAPTAITPLPIKSPAKPVDPFAVGFDTFVKGEDR